MGEDATEPANAAPSPRPKATGGCLLMALVVGGLVAFTVIVVVSLALVGVIGGESSAEERAEILAEIEEESGIATANTDIDDPPQRDLRMGLCEVDAAGTMVVRGSVTNPLDEPARYELTVVFQEGSGARLGAELARSVVTVDEVDPEAVADWSVESGAPAPADFSCRVVRIERTP
jgi:hypothetical protein